MKISRKNLMKIVTIIERERHNATYYHRERIAAMRAIEWIGIHEEVRSVKNDVFMSNKTKERRLITLYSIAN